MADSVCLIITTFKNPKALDLVLSSVEQQTKRPQQIVIADDGSDTESHQVVKKYLTRLPIELTWQPDIEFRAARSRNLAISRVTTDYVIFIDGDCILPRSFVESHLKLSGQKILVAGGRSLLDEKTTAKLLTNTIDINNNLLFAGFKFWRAPLGPIRDIQNKNWESVRTCNMSISLKNIHLVNGFDERYIGWGKEDSDFIVRLLHAGIKIRSGRLAACVCHLHHITIARTRLSTNIAKFNDTLRQKGKYMGSKSSLSDL